jgi:hypothetical protein
MFKAINGAISGSIIKSCADIFVHVLKHVFNLSLSQQYSPILWKESAIVPVRKKPTVPLLGTTDQ